MYQKLSSPPLFQQDVSAFSFWNVNLQNKISWIQSIIVIIFNGSFNALWTYKYFLSYCCCSWNLKDTQLKIIYLYIKSLEYPYLPHDTYFSTKQYLFRIVYTTQHKFKCTLVQNPDFCQKSFLEICWPILMPNTAN